MSYDIYLRGDVCPTCNCRSVDETGPNPTYNLTGIFDLALTGEPMPNQATDRPRGLRLLSGRKAGETRADIDAALVRLFDPAMHAAFAALEPSNGWGTKADAVKTFRTLREMVDENPGCTWEIR